MSSYQNRNAKDGHFQVHFSILRNENAKDGHFPRCFLFIKKIFHRIWQCGKVTMDEKKKAWILEKDDFFFIK